MELMRREGELRMLKREIRKNKKDREQAERNYKFTVQSRTWKMLLPLRKIISFYQFVQSLLLGSKYRELKEENRKLLEETLKLQQELKAVQEEFKEKRYLEYVRITDNDGVRNKLRQAKQAGVIIDDLEQLIRKKQADELNYRNILKYAARLFAHERSDYREIVYNKTLSGFKIEEIPEFIVREAETSNTIPLKRASSFRANLSIQARERQLGMFVPAWVLDNKTVAYKFVDSLGVKRPWITNKTFSRSHIPKEEGIVIKPQNGAGSRGVYLVLGFNEIQDVKRSQILHSWDDLLDHIEKDLSSGWVEHDEWVMEELIYEDVKKKLPARDIKFYCFYGKIALILEIQRFPVVKYCWWTSDKKRVRTGKYEENLFEGRGISDKEIDLAAYISSEIPAPFIRIDFLKSETGMVFGEFTPKPGNYDEFDELTDQKLGDYYLDAKGRLFTDLLNGKQFHHFKKIASDLDISFNKE